MTWSQIFHTLRHLQPVQIYGRAWFRLTRPRLAQRAVPDARPLPNNMVLPIAKPISQVGHHRFRLLNLEHDLTKTTDWNNPGWDKLWLYNLHYFDDLHGEAAASRQAWHVALIKRWITENPVGLGNGWEPYPLSLRLVNWTKWSLAGNQLSPEALQSLAVQARYLRQRLEIHLLGNHLFANATALIFVGLFFAGPEAEEWLAKGLAILGRELPEQILPDGGHFERTPMYHAIILENLLDLLNVMGAYGHNAPPTWRETVQRMLAWLAGMCHPDGDIALFNDAAFAIAARPGQLFTYASRLGFQPPRPLAAGLTHFAPSGYIRWQQGLATVLLDVAPLGPDYLPGHGHADTLSFELSLGQQRVIVDSGTSLYKTGAERLRQRGTAAHNTVTIDGLDSSEVWGGFRVARRARPLALRISTSATTATVACSHSGYFRLTGKPLHRRQWDLAERSLLITDTIIGPFRQAVGRLHFHPDMQVIPHGNTTLGTIVLPDGVRLSWEIRGGQGTVVATTWHPEFGKSIPNQCLEVRFESQETTISLSW